MQTTLVHVFIMPLQHFSLLAIIFGLYFVLSESSSYHEEEKKLLYRQRRYLIFPDGSSLQLVYDQIIPFEDYTNLWIIGVTVALAWELPNSPHIPEKHHEHPEHNKTRIFERKKYVKHANETEQSGQGSDWNDFSYFSYYNHENYHNHRIGNEHRDFLLSKIKTLRNHRNKEHFRDFIPLGAKTHSIYPALRMRRHIEENWKVKRNQGLVHPETIGYLKHHRTSRFSLFRSIEKYLNANGQNGSECIARAICETVQKTNDNWLNATEKHPKSFLKELLRVVFSLPSSKFHATGYNSQHKHASSHQKYDEALNLVNHNENFNLQTNCAERYPGCKQSIWCDDFWF